MYKVRDTLLSLGADLVSNKLVHLLSNIEPEDVLHSVGLSRRRRRWPQNLAFVGAGVLIGGVAALALAPQSGKELRARFVRKRSKLGSTTSEKSNHPANDESGDSDHQVSNRDDSANGGTAAAEILSHDQKL